MSCGDNHLTATLINNLANTCLSGGMLDAAEALYRRGLAATEKLLGPDHYAVAISLDWLARTNFRQGRYAESQGRNQEATAIKEHAEQIIAKSRK